MSMTEAARTEFLKSLNLNPDAPALNPVPAAAPANVPAGVDLHTIPVDDIVFDEALLEGFDLGPKARSAALAHVFSLYKGRRGDDRNKVLHAKIGQWLVQVHRSRTTGGAVKEKIKVSTETNELAMLLQAHGLTSADLAALLTAKEVSA